MRTPNGWWGMVVFVATEATLFGTLVGTYVYLRFQNAHWPPPSNYRSRRSLTPLAADRRPRRDERPDAARVALGARGSARPRVVGARRRARGAGRLPRRGRCTTTSHDDRRLPAAGSAYASIYFTSSAPTTRTSLVGVLLDAWFVLRISHAADALPRSSALQATAFYWHAVNMLTDRRPRRPALAARCERARVSSSCSGSASSAAPLAWTAAARRGLRHQRRRLQRRRPPVGPRRRHVAGRRSASRPARS